MRAARRPGLAARRTASALAVGAGTLAAALAAGARWPVAFSGGWGAAALVILGVVWTQILPMDSAQTRAHARSEDFSRATADGVVLAASVASLVAIGYLLNDAGNREGVTKTLLILLAATVVALSWLTVPTLYTLRYGDLYYGDPVGGIDFGGDDPPDYRDFAYLALTVAMTFQVSDTGLRSTALRRVVIRQALLSFVFVMVILAVAINTVASLLS